jgi:hypothetical protein
MIDPSSIIVFENAQVCRNRKSNRAVTLAAIWNFRFLSDPNRRYRLNSLNSAFSA